MPGVPDCSGPSGQTRSGVSALLPGSCQSLDDGGTEEVSTGYTQVPLVSGSDPGRHREGPPAERVVTHESDGGGQAVPNIAKARLQADHCEEGEHGGDGDSDTESTAETQEDEYSSCHQGVADAHIRGTTQTRVEPALANAEPQSDADQNAGTDMPGDQGHEPTTGSDGYLRQGHHNREHDDASHCRKSLVVEPECARRQDIEWTVSEQMDVGAALSHDGGRKSVAQCQLLTERDEQNRNVDQCARASTTPPAEHMPRACQQSACGRDEYVPLSQPFGDHPHHRDGPEHCKKHP